MASIQAAVTRKRWADDLPDQRQTLLEAIAGYTRDGAYAEFMEDRKGTLEEGRLADIVVLSGDVERVEPEGLHAVRPVATVCDGRVSFEA
jgi:predicted amidohydrolase YtcJ